MYKWVCLIYRETLVAAHTSHHLNIALFLLRTFSITGCTDIWCLFQGISLRKDMKRKEPNSLVHTCQEVRTELCLGCSSLQCIQIINLQVVLTTVVYTNSVTSGPGLSLKCIWQIFICSIKSPIFLPRVLMCQKREISLPVGYKTATPKTGNWKWLWRQFRTPSLAKNRFLSRFLIVS